MRKIDTDSSSHPRINHRQLSNIKFEYAKNPVLLVKFHRTGLDEFLNALDSFLNPNMTKVHFDPQSVNVKTSPLI